MSSTASSAIKAYTKTKAAKAQLDYVEKEAEMISLHLLKFQKAAAVAEAAAYKEAETKWRNTERVLDRDEPILTVRRNREYIQQQSEFISPQMPLMNAVAVI